MLTRGATGRNLTRSPSPRLSRQARSSGRPVWRIAAELGVNHETLRQWIKTAEKAARPEAART
ncbi:transposase [Streptomyces mirabilis]|uniref:transposase n=1 Tax=Streptomyces mirabilis TaxID=68239 RepID=UPI0036DE70F1